MGEFSYRVLERPDVLDLAAGVAMHQPEAIRHVPLAQRLDDLQHLGGEEAELRLVARRFAPAPGARARELDAHPDRRPDAVALRVLQDQPELGEILHDGDNEAPELRGERDRLDVPVILEAVTDDGTVGGHAGHRHDREQLGLGSDLEAEVVPRPLADDLLDDRALLVDLDRIHRDVAARVPVLLDRGLKGVVKMQEPVREDVGEPDQHRGVKTPRLEATNHVVEIDLAPGSRIRAHQDMPGRADVEIPPSPRADLVSSRRVEYGPPRRG